MLEGMHIQMSANMPPNGIVATSKVILCGKVQYAMLCAQIDFQKRNWRRLKREVNKAARKARRAP